MWKERERREKMIFRGGRRTSAAPAPAPPPAAPPSRPRPSPPPPAATRPRRRRRRRRRRRWILQHEPPAGSAGAGPHSARVRKGEGHEQGGDVIKRGT